VQKRLDQAIKELEFAEQPGIHDKVVVNDDFERTYVELNQFIMSLLE